MQLDMQIMYVQLWFLAYYLFIDLFDSTQFLL